MLIVFRLALKLSYTLKVSTSASWFISSYVLHFHTADSISFFFLTNIFFFAVPILQANPILYDVQVYRIKMSVCQNKKKKKRLLQELSNAFFPTFDVFFFYKSWCENHP